jgi:hypothetical protein
MYKTILVSQMIEDGVTLLRRLDDRGMPVSAAAWFEDPEKQSWKLVIVTSAAENPGPLEAYTQIQFAMNGLELSFALDDITVMGPTSRKFEEFRRIMEGATGGQFLHPKLPSTGVALDDAYVYRWLVK